MAMNFWCGNHTRGSCGWLDDSLRKKAIEKRHMFSHPTVFFLSKASLRIKKQNLPFDSPCAGANGSMQLLREQLDQSLLGFSQHGFIPAKKNGSIFSRFSKYCQCLNVCAEAFGVCGNRPHKCQPCSWIGTDLRFWYHYVPWLCKKNSSFSHRQRTGVFHL